MSHIDLLTEALLFVEEGEQFHKPTCRGLSKRIRAAINGQEPDEPDLLAIVREQHRIIEAYLAGALVSIPVSIRHQAANIIDKIDGTTTHRDALAARLTFSHPTQEHAHE